MQISAHTCAARSFRDGGRHSGGRCPILELRQLVYFVRLAEVRNFSRVAESEHITQSAVSQQINRLERSLGVRLFHRSTHRTRITAEGEALLPRAQDIVRQAKSLEDTAQALTRRLTGQLRIGSPFHGAQSPQRQAVLTRLDSEHPEVDVSIHNSWSSELINLLRSGTLDLAFVNLSLVELCPPPDLSDLDVALVADAPCDFLVPDDHSPRLEADGTEKLDFSAITVLMYPRELNPWLHDQRRAVLEGVGAAARELREPSLPGIIADVSAGRGVFPAIPWELPPEGTAEGVRVVRLGNSQFRANLWAVRRRDSAHRVTDWIFRDLVRSRS